MSIIDGLFGKFSCFSGRKQDETRTMNSLKQNEEEDEEEEDQGPELDPNLNVK